MRIVGGKFAGRDLVSPGGRVRPTGEELRDAWLTEFEGELAGAKVLDLFSGTGALGLEAFSRGARSVTFVENGAEALHALKANLASFRVRNRTRLFKKNVFQFLEGVEGQEYTLALADPPYTSEAAERLVSLWLKKPFSTILSVEHAADRRLPGRGSRRVFGDSAITTYRMKKR